MIASAGTVGALNESGAVAGNTGDSHAFLYRNGEVNDLGTLGGERSSGTGINDSGQVSGTTELPDDGSLRAPIRAFIYSNGVMTDLGVLEGGRGSQGSRINNRGEVTGGADLPPIFGFHAFLYRDGQMLDLGHLGGGTSVGYDINDRGQVVGESGSAADGRPHAFLYSDGEMRDLGTLGGNISSAYAINATGQVTGQAFTSSSRLHAFFYTGGRMEDLGVLLEGGLSIGRGINSKGWVVGLTDTETGPVAFVHDGTEMHDLNALLDASGEGWIVYNAYDVNDAGAIAAVALRGSRRRRCAFVPPPCPTYTDPDADREAPIPTPPNEQRGAPLRNYPSRYAWLPDLGSNQGPTDYATRGQGHHFIISLPSAGSDLMFR